MPVRRMLITLFPPPRVQSCICDGPTPAPRHRHPGARPDSDLCAWSSTTSGGGPFPTKRTYLNTPHSYVRFRAIDTCDLVVDTNHSLTAWHSLRLRRHRQLRAVCVLLYGSYMFDRYDEVGHVGHRESYHLVGVWVCINGTAKPMTWFSIA